MNIFQKIILIFLAYVCAEIYVFIEVSIKIGFINSLLILLLFSIAGYVITKIVKGASFRAAMADFAEGKSPSRNLIKSATYFIAGVMFLMPGFISDFVAILFLVPFLNFFLLYIMNQ